MTTTHPLEVNNGITTSWLPLTTGTSIPAGCSSQMYIVPYGAQTIIAYDPWAAEYIPWVLNCEPSEVSKSWSQAATATLRYSLGPFQCPSQYVTATTSAINSLSTSVLCCPSQYTYTVTDSTLQCFSTLTTGSVVPLSLVQTSGSWVSWTNTTISPKGTTMTIMGHSAEGFIFAEATTTASIPLATATTTITQVASTPTNPPRPSSPPSTPPPSNSGLGTGAKAGIAIGSAVGVLALFAVLFMFLRSRRRRTAAVASPIYETDAVQSGFKPEIKQSQVHEIPGEASPLNGGRVYEMDGRHHAELP